MWRKVARLSIIGALCLSVAGPWCALQSIAWAAMLVTNVCHEPLSVAVAQTFDGKHPCHICHVVAEGKKSEKKSEVLPAVVKIDLICAVKAVSNQPSPQNYRYLSYSDTASRRVETPLAPPPRCLLS